MTLTRPTRSPLRTEFVEALGERVPASVATGAGQILVGAGEGVVETLPAGQAGQMLVADPDADLGVAWAQPVLDEDGPDTVPAPTAPAWDVTAMRYGCKALTFAPHSLSWSAPQYLEMVPSRLYQYWLPLPAGTIVTGVRLPVQLHGVGAGALRFAVYSTESALLGQTGDVAASFLPGTVDATWQSRPLTAPVTTVTDGLWVVALSTLDTGVRVAFCNTSSTAELPAWLLNPDTQRTAVRTEGVTTLPATLSPQTATPYIDFLIGVY